MDDLEQLPAGVRSRLLRALEAACQVRHRGELFLWSQGPLHALMPHGAMVCLELDAHRGVRHHESLHAVPLEADVVARLQDPHHGVLAQAARWARSAGAALLVLDAQRHAADSAERALAQQFAELGVAPGLLHCTGPLPDSAGIVTLLLAMAGPPDAAQELLLRVLAPQVHLGFLRSREFESKRAAARAHDGPRELGLTQRQIEILHWVKLGKTNHETALILSVSELTVKNHLQRVFRKLNVHNRAQAVARLMSLESR